MVRPNGRHLRRLLDHGGEAAAGALMARLGDTAEAARVLAYRLYIVCERRGWAEEGRAYNGLVVAWPDLEKLAGEAPAPTARPRQGALFGDD